MELNFNGVRLNVNSRDSADGSLLECENLIMEGSSLKAIETPSVMLHKTGITPLCVHTVTSKYLISKRDTDLVAFDMEGNMFSEIELGFFDDKIFKDMRALGNTLVITTQRGTFYALFTQEGYKMLGEKPPEAEIRFGLQGTFKTGYDFTLWDGTFEKNILHNTGDLSDELNITGPLNLDRDFGTEAKNNHVKNWVDYITAVGMAKMNKFIADAHEDGNFIFPFFVRYAYKMWDGSYMMHSAPILMVPSTGYPSILVDQLVGYHDDNDHWRSWVHGHCTATLCKIDYSVEKCDLSQWKDIIKGIDIFVSAPVYQYDYSGKIYGWKYYENNSYPPFSIGKIDASTDYKNGSSKHYYDNYDYISYLRQFSMNSNMDENNKQLEGTVNWLQNPKLYNTLEGYKVPKCFVRLPMKEDKTFMDELKETALFYKAFSIDTDNIKTGIQLPDLPENFIQSMQSREQLTDDYKTHVKLSADVSYVYNSRLHLANVEEFLFEGFGEEMFCRQKISYPATSGISAKYYVYIKKAGKLHVVEHAGTVPPNPQQYYFYPDADAYRMVIVTNSYKQDIKLTEHPFLSGAYSFNSFTQQRIYTDDTPTESAGSHKYGSKVYASEAGNPFIFNPSSINTIGTGEIRALASATEAISTGQFGEFPMYCFSTDGIWALSISSTGGVSSKQPVSRDVILNSEVLALSRSLVFATQKGIMILEGAASKCLSEVLKIDTAVPLVSVPPLSGRLAYDYKNDRIWVMGDGKSWVYSLKSGTWSTCTDTFDFAINDYIDTYLWKGENLYSISGEKTERNVSLVTQPIKGSMPDITKLVSKVLLRGISDTPKMMTLYGTMDFISYVKIATGSKLERLRGSGYKGYILQVKGVTDTYESVTGISFDMVTKRTNKLI